MTFPVKLAFVNMHTRTLICVREVTSVHDLRHTYRQLWSRQPDPDAVKAFLEASQADGSEIEVPIVFKR